MKAWRAAALLTGLLVLGANARHLLRDASPPAWDDAWYLETSFKLHHALGEGVVPFARAYAGAFGTKAPLIAVLPLPLYAALGPSERLAPWALQPLLALSWFLTYLIGRRLHGERAGLAAAAALALMPAGWRLSRVFLVECALMAAVCWAQWLILTASDARARAWPRGLALGLGLLVKFPFPLYVAGTAWLQRRALRPRAAAALALGGAVAATWYAFNLPAAVGFALSAGFGEIGRSYGAALSPGAVLRYFDLLLGQSVSWPLCAGALLTIAAAAPLRVERFLTAWALPPLAVLCLAVNKDPRYALPLLPALALALGAAADRAAARGRAWAPAAALALGLWTLASEPPPNPDPGWDRAAAVRAAAEAAPGGGVVAVAFEHRLFNANNLASLAAEASLPLSFVNLGHAQPSAEGALIRLKDKGATHLLLVDGAPPADLPAFLNRANEGVRAAVLSGRLPSSRAGEARLDAGRTAVLYALRRPK